MKKIITLFSFIVCILHANAQTNISSDTILLDYANPKEYIIAGLRVEGIQYFDNEVIKTVSGLSVNDKVKIPGEKISGAIENLWKQGLFEDIRITAEKIFGNEIFLVIHVTERPRLSKFSVKGLKKSDADDVREKIKLVKGKPVTEALIVSMKSTINEHFKDKGYLNCKVNIPAPQKDTALNNSLIVDIIVSKGRKVKVQDIIFHGNSYMSNRKLWRTMKEVKRKRFYTIFKSSKFVESEYEKDKQKIMEKYLTKGFRDMKIVRDTVYQLNNKRLAIEIYLNEGRKYYFRNITWVGNSKYSSKELSKVLGIKKGDVFDQSQLEARLFMNPNSTDVSSLYMDDGYLFFNINPMEVLVENDSIDIEMRVSEGKQATINKVTVTGNTKTNDRVVMREIRTRPGQLFRRSDVIRSQRELSQLGFFDPEKLSVNPSPNPQTGTVDIDYVVEEKASDQLELSGGFGGGRVVGTLGVSFTNFSARNMFHADAWKPLPSGDGQRLSLRAQSNGLFYQSYSFSFTEPWLGGKKPNSFSFSIYQNVQTNGQRKKIGGELNPLRQDLNITGISFGLGQRLEWPDDFFTRYLEISGEQYLLNNFRSVFSFTDGRAYNVSATVNFQRNSIDQPIYPRSGSQFSFSTKFTLPYSAWKKDSLGNYPDYKTMKSAAKYKWIEYYKVKFSAAWYTKLVDNLVLYNRIGLGFLGYYDKNLGAAPFERFYLGGGGLSGFSLDGREIIALRGYDDGALSSNFGATSIVKYKMELRYPISLNPSATVYGLGFAEAGNSWSTFKDFNPFNVKRSAGIGMRIFLPMFGILGLDYGWRFDDVKDAPFMQKSQFHFTIGIEIGEL